MPNFELMKRIIGILPDHVLILLKRFGIILMTMYFTRIVFLLSNLSAFQNLSFSDFIVAIWFDIITICLLFIPYYGLYLLPVPFRHTKAYKICFKLYFHITSALIIGLNLMDVEYFKYTSKRSTFDIWSMFGGGGDLGQLWGTFLQDFWFVIVLYILLIVLTEYLYRRIDRKAVTRLTGKTFYKTNIIWFFIMMPTLFVIGRGGFNLKPIGIIEATRYTEPENLAFVLPTAFTMIKTIDQGGLEPVRYMSDEEALRYFDPIKTTQPQNILPDKTNVVIIMLESFGTEFVGAYNSGKGYTPFLDSIIGQSLTFDYSFANGKRSIEAVPAVIASMPTLMENAYISSPYGNNKINTLPNILKKHGYESAFFHGATNGSMSFDGFSRICGFDHYYGRYEYNNDDHYDKTWGILDEYFNPWSVRKMSKMKEPFFSTIFTISSHHPYFIPKHMRSKVKRGPQEICASINYGDYSLKKFFEEAKKQSWFNNTLFVLLADHTPATTSKVYNQRTHIFRVPIAFYHPGGNLKAERSDRTFQQLDIMPTILDLLNIETDYYAFGNSYYSPKGGDALVYMSGAYSHFKDGRMTMFSDNKARSLYNYTLKKVDLKDSLSYYKKESQSVEMKIKAMIQRYNHDLLQNQTTINETKH
jgi:phosphoglycerol transferase MdoB-like AlkP superfamily enzyme